jgi:hypothetical protein
VSISPSAVKGVHIGGIMPWRDVGSNIVFSLYQV